MKKFSLALFILVILGIIAFIWMINSHTLPGPLNSPTARSPNINDGHSLTQGEKADALKILTVDPLVKSIIDDGNSQYQLEYSGSSGSGVYTNDDGQYTVASMQTSLSGEQVRFTVIVETSAMREMGAYYTGIPPIMNSWIIIPPGNGIYTGLYNAYNLSSPRKYAVPEISSGAYSMNITPADIRLYPLILDEDNFKKYRNGSPYEVPELIDEATGEGVRIDGSRPMASGWSALYILPPDRQSYRMGSDFNTTYYLILTNRDASREARIEYVSPPFAYDLPVPTP